MSDYKEVYIGFQVPPALNRLLTQASERSGRSKAKEAEIRLTDHLTNFTDIASVGKRFGHQKTIEK